jgi:hypothetical protein
VASAVTGVRPARWTPRFYAQRRRSGGPTASLLKSLGLGFDGLSLRLGSEARQMRAGLCGAL